MRLIAILALCALAGCATSYTTPGRGAQMNMFGAATPEVRDANTDAGIKAVLERKPLASFPTAVAVVRVQQANYRSQTASGWGNGQYSIVTQRDIENPADVERLGKLPMLRGLAPLNRLVLPATLQTDLELRQAAARMHADMLLIYTLDTTFHDVDKTTPISLVTLGTTSTKRMRILSTASAALLDTRSGYVYGLAETTKDHEELQNAWKTEEAIDRNRRDVETRAFAGLVSELETTWGGVIKEYAKPAQAGARYETAPQ